jgi:5-methylcytosine-specific restriction protein A
MQQPLCVACEQAGKVSAAEEVDHVVPLAKGGADDDTNLQSLCRECHQAKTRRDNGWRERVEVGVDGWPTGVG